MKRKIMSLIAFVLLLCLLGTKMEEEKECWLRTEENGIVHSVDYLHELAENEPTKAREYLGKPISFVAPIISIDENVSLGYFGHIKCLLRFSANDGREFWVDSGRDYNMGYQKGELLKVSGKVSQLDPQRVLLLNVSGTPGWPNEITIEKIK